MNRKSTIPQSKVIIKRLEMKKPIGPQVLKDNGYDFSNLPKEDLAILRTEDPDFSKVSPPTQDLLFLADKLQHPTFVVNDLAEGKLSPMDAWLDYHWSGSKKERPNKVALWNRTFI